MKRLLVAALALLLVLAACSADTEPATNVTDTSATLNGKIKCDQGDGSGEWWWETGQSGTFTRVGARNVYDCQGNATASVPITFNATGLTPSTTYQFRLCQWTSAQQANTICVDANGTVFGPTSPPGNVSYDSFTTLAQQGPTIPSNATLQQSYNFNTGLGNGLSTSQCRSDRVSTGTDGSHQYTRFVREVGDAQVAGGNRCETQTSQFVSDGEWWFQFVSRYPRGYPDGSWETAFQVHEANVGSVGALDLGMFYENGSMRLDGESIPLGGSCPTDVTTWHTYTIHANMQSTSAGYAELWIDNTFCGRVNGRTKIAGNNSYLKMGFYSGADAAATVDFDDTKAWSIP